MLPLFAFLVGATSVYSLTCHCLNGSKCGTNGFCANGCERLWNGPGCQVGDLGFNKTARQSTNHSDEILYSASAALDGLAPNDQEFAHCSHTALDNPLVAMNGFAWWVVTLNSTLSYVIIDVTLVNRKGPHSYRLTNFSILYSNETEGDPDPSSSTWHEFARENGTVGHNRTYTCNNTAIAKRVAVYLRASPNNTEAILTLCEVQINGYEQHDCPSGFTGPGCLLRACNQCSSTGKNCTGNFGSCRYDVCPDESLLPPDCWITLSNLSRLEVEANATCNSVLFSAVLRDTQPNMAASWLQLQVTTSADRQVLENAKLSLQGNDSVYYNFSSATADTSYNLSLKLVYCDSTKSSCFNSTGSKVLTVLTGKREYVFSSNTSCVFVNMSSTTHECEPVSTIQITCESEVVGGSTVNSSSLTVCGLESDRGYNCSITATINADTVENQSAYIVTGPHSTSIALKENVTGATSGVLPIAIGGSVAVLVIIVTIFAFLYCRRQKKRKFHGSLITLVTNENDHEPTGTLDATRLPSSFSATPFIVVDEQPYSNLSGMKLPQFQLYVQNEALIARRFSELQANNAHPCTHGKFPENKGRNRFTDIMPYDFNRVRLDTAANDYINASYINGFSKPKEYIAAQGPSAKTVEDFWHMLWQEKCSVIIMLTHFVEHAKKKCAKYFPFSKSHEMDIEVTIRSSTVCDTHTITVLNVRHGSEVRLVHHFHFLAWPDQSVPSHSAEMLLFYSRMCLHLKRQPTTGPLIVHCSAGVGRTGAYIAFDYLLKRYQSESTVDVDSCVVKLRDQRMLMVQTKEQYVYLHRAVLYGLKTIRYIYDIAVLPSLARSGTSPSNGISIEMDTEWQELQAVVPTFNEHSFATAALPENRHKNRRSQILALESKRPILFRPDGGDQLYINAIYCNGCYSNRAFIATQLPVPETVDDFWLMVYECQPSCIIQLHDLPTDDKDFPRYWPESGHSMTAGWLEVKCDLALNEDSAVNARMPGFNISLSAVPGRMTASQTVSTKLFTTSLWGSKISAELPTNTNDLVLVANELRKYFIEAPRQPIIVQCRDGATQSGLFLSAVNALHRLIETDQVSVFHTVDLLRTSRPEFITSKAQYRFIYQVLETYHDTLNVYANT